MAWMRRELYTLSIYHDFRFVKRLSFDVAVLSNAIRRAQEILSARISNYTTYKLVDIRFLLIQSYG